MQLARDAELSLGHTVDKEVAAVADVLDRNLRGDVIDDLAQERLVPVAFLFELAAIGNVFHRRDPAAMCQWLADRQEGTPVGALHGAVVDLAARDAPHDGGAERVDVAGERTGVLAMLHQVAEMRARFHDVGRQTVHVDVAPVESDDVAGGVVEHQALDHVVQRGIELAPFRLEPLLRLAVLPRDLPDDQEQDQGDRHRGQCGGNDEKSGLRAPVGQCGRHRVGRDHSAREMLEWRRGAEPVDAVDRALQAQRLCAASVQDAL